MKKEALYGWRSFLAIGIFIGHLGVWGSFTVLFQCYYPRSGGYAVTAFFILSGIGIALSTSGQKFSTSLFWKKRFLSIYLPHILVIAFIVIMLYWKTGNAISLKRILDNMLLVYDITGTDRLNPPMWFASRAVFCYILTPFILYAFGKLIKNRQSAGIGLSLILLSKFAVLFSHDSDTIMFLGGGHLSYMGGLLLCRV